MMTHNLYNLERLFNIITFSLFCVVIAYYFVLSERDTAKLSNEQREETEALLRIVLPGVANQISITINSHILLEKYIQRGNLASLDRPLSKIHRSTNEITNTIRKLRELYSVKDGTKEFILESINPKILINDISNILQDKLSNKNISIELKSNQDIMVKSDPTILKNVILSNIISNAIKFSNNNSKILITLDSYKNYGVISIKDSGIGIPPEILKTLFSFTSNTNRTGTKSFGANYL